MGDWPKLPLPFLSKCDSHTFTARRWKSKGAGWLTGRCHSRVKGDAFHVNACSLFPGTPCLPRPFLAETSCVPASLGEVALQGLARGGYLYAYQIGRAARYAVCMCMCMCMCVAWASRGGDRITKDGRSREVGRGRAEIGRGRGRSGEVAPRPYLRPCGEGRGSGGWVD